MDYLVKITSVQQVQKNKWNFYGITRKSSEGFMYEVPRINILVWPTSIKNIVTAAALVKNKKLLTCSYYLN